MKRAINEQFDIWVDRTPETAEVKAARVRVQEFLDTLTEEQDKRLFEYISEVQRQAYEGGYCMAMRLAAECFSGKCGYDKRD
ncbi:MAG: hypothetical protein LUI14_05835 [Lachnospiraceae bacterium]|nr:hypothetical protein [Lachnospiraceae bacterium]